MFNVVRVIAHIGSMDIIAGDIGRAAPPISIMEVHPRGTVYDFEVIVVDIRTLEYPDGTLIPSTDNGVTATRGYGVVCDVVVEGEVAYL